MPITGKGSPNGFGRRYNEGREQASAGEALPRNVENPTYGLAGRRSQKDRSERPLDLGGGLARHHNRLL